MHSPMEKKGKAKLWTIKDPTQELLNRPTPQISMQIKGGVKVVLRRNQEAAQMVY